MLLTLTQTPKGKIACRVCSSDSNRVIADHTSFFLSLADFKKGSKALGVPSSLLQDLAQQCRNSDDAIIYDTCVVPDVTFRIRAETSSVITTETDITAAIQVAGYNGVVEWDSNEHYCVLDLDFHGGNAPSCNELDSIALTLAPTPLAWWVSRSCGLHVVYRSIGIYTATELAAVAAYYLQRRFPASTVEFLSRTRGVPSDNELHICTPDTNLRAANPLLMRHDSVDAEQYLSAHGLEVGQRLAHTLCPVNPHERSLHNSPPVVVQPTGIMCYICEADRIYRGSDRPGYFPYYALMGTRCETLLAKCVTHWSHWGHAKFVVAQSVRDIQHGRYLYSALLKAKHGEDVRITEVFAACEPLGLVRYDGFWADYNGSVLEVTKSPILTELPACSNAVDMAWLSQTIDLTEIGYPAVTAIRGVQITQFQDQIGDKILTIVPTEIRPDARPRYVPLVFRMDERAAWDVLEHIFPSVNRALIRTLIGGCGCVEQRAGLAPMLFLSGPTGVGKSSHVELAAGICGESSTEVGFNRDSTRFFDSIFRAKQNGRFVAFNEFLKTAAQERVEPARAMETLLNFTPATQFHLLYIGSVRLGLLPFFIWTDSEIPDEILSHEQIARRLHVCNLQIPLTWKKTLPQYGLSQIHLLRNLGGDVVKACDAILSYVIDAYFIGGLTDFADICEDNGIASMLASNVLNSRDDMIRELYRLWQAAPDIIDPSTKQRWSKKGLKVVEKELKAAYEALQTEKEINTTNCRALTEASIHTILKAPNPIVVEKTKLHGSRFAIRFIEDKK